MRINDDQPDKVFGAESEGSTPFTPIVRHARDRSGGSAILHNLPCRGVGEIAISWRPKQTLHLNTNSVRSAVNYHNIVGLVQIIFFLLNYDSSLVVFLMCGN